MQMKICNKCKLEKSINDFSNKHNKCNSCRNQEYKEKNNFRKCIICSITKTRQDFVGSKRHCIQCSSLMTSNIKESKRKSSIKYCKEHPDKIKIKNSIIFKRKYYSDSPEKIITYRLQSCRKRAKDKNIDYDLDWDFILKMYNDQNGKCAVTGLPFESSFNDSFSKRPFSISIDRIDSKIGYIKSNVRLVCSIYKYCA